MTYDDCKDVCIVVKLIQEWYMLPEVREKRKRFKSKIPINFIVMIIIYNKCS